MANGIPESRLFQNWYFHEKMPWATFLFCFYVTIFLEWLIFLKNWQILRPTSSKNSSEIPKKGQKYKKICWKFAEIVLQNWGWKISKSRQFMKKISDLQQNLLQNRVFYNSGFKHPNFPEKFYNLKKWMIWYRVLTGNIDYDSVVLLTLWNYLHKQTPLSTYLVLEKNYCKQQWIKLWDKHETIFLVKYFKMDSYFGLF